MIKAKTAEIDDLTVQELCQALDVPRATYYRKTAPGKARQPKQPPRKLSLAEEENVLAVLNSDRFCDSSPGEVYATLLDEGIYYCSERTMYRVLKKNRQNLQRRQAAARPYQRPELLANGVNQLWSWDITKLKGAQKWTYYYLYKIIDVYSRYVVGWMIAERESAGLAAGLISETCLKQNISPNELTLHADRGSSMTSGTVGELLVDLGITKTHSRPYTSNDNPYSESAFKTLKYRPGFPERFYTIQEARDYCRMFFYWYNSRHRHSGIAMLTPETVHYGKENEALKNRELILKKAYLKYPERFVKGMPKVAKPDSQVWINKPVTSSTEENIVLKSELIFDN